MGSLSKGGGSSCRFFRDLNGSTHQMTLNFLWPVFSILCALTSCAWLEHPVSHNLRQALAKESEQGLALATFTPAQPALEVDYFNGQRQTVSMKCCPPIYTRTICRNRIVMVDMTAAPTLDPVRDPKAFLPNLSAYGGPVVAIDPRSGLVARSIVDFSPATVSLAPDLEHFVLMGTPLGHPNWPQGINIGSFHGREPRSLMRVQAAQHYERPDMAPTLDWSPDGKTILFSYLGAISLVDLATGKSRKIADGTGASWSPSADWIAYISLKSPSQVVLLNLATGDSKVVDTGKQAAFPIEWSPEGKYLLIRAGNDISYGGRPRVYRVSDGAWAPAVPDYMTVGLHWHWIEMQNTQQSAEPR